MKTIIKRTERKLDSIPFLNPRNHFYETIVKNFISYQRKTGKLRVQFSE